MAATSVSAVAPASAWADYRPDAEPVYRPQERGAMEAPGGMRMVTDDVTDETVQAIKDLPAVKDLGLFAQDLERCRRFFQDGVGSPYVRGELRVTKDPINLLLGDWIYRFYLFCDTFNGTAMQTSPPAATQEYFIQVIHKSVILVFSHKNETFTLSTYDPPANTPMKDLRTLTAETITFDNFDSAGRKINELLRQLGARPADEMLKEAAYLKRIARSTLAEYWIQNKFPWKCPTFKSKERMLEWIHYREGLWGRNDYMRYVLGKIEGAGYHIAIQKVINGYSTSPEIYELGLKNRPYDLWRKGPSPIFLKIGDREWPLTFSALEEHEMGGMSADQATTAQRKVLEEELGEIFGVPAFISRKPVSECEDLCDTLPAGCCFYYCCCWYCCCDEL